MITAIRGRGTSSLRRRLSLVLVVSGVLGAVVLGASIALLVSVRNQQSRVVNRYFDAKELSDQLFTELLDAETAVRGYALTGDNATLRPYAEATSAASRDKTRRLDSLVAGDAKVSAALHTAEQSAGRWYQQWVIPTVAEIRTQGSAAVTDSDILRGKQLFDAVRSDFGRYSTLLTTRRRAASSALIARTDTLLATVSAAAVALVIAGAGLWLALRRWILRPLDALGVESRKVASGQLDRRLDASGPAEVQRLGRDVEAMREQLVGQLLEVQAARRQMQESNDALSRQRRELERSNRDLEQFAYVASHDLQEPLRKVASFCQMLESRYRGQLDDRADQYIAFAVDGAKRMQRLINDLLEFSRVGRSSRPADRVDLQTCLDRALGNLEHSITTTGAVVTADPLPQVRGTQELLVQLFQNLVANAIKFRRAGAAPHVHIGARREGDRWELSVADDGIGIEPQYADRVFVIFQRLHAREAFEGTGIGLAMCKKIVEYHGGEIWLDTTAAPGATFRWTLLPAGTSPERPDAEPALPTDESPPKAARMML